MGIDTERLRSLVAGRLASGVMVVVLIMVGFLSTLPPTAQGADAPATEFSAARAMEHVNEIAREPHPLGSPESERVGAYLVSELEALGLEIDLQTFMAPDYYAGAGRVELANVIGWIPGTANTGAVVLIAHYDTVPSTPGANDNSAAVAALLEAARALRAGPPLANDVVFLFTDAEEPSGPSGHFGARAFVSLPDVVDGLGVVVNFEANGSSGASTLVETNGSSSWLIGEFSAAAPHPVAFSFLTEVAEWIGEIGTDFDVLSDAGVPGVNFAYLRGSPIYHTDDDDIDSVGQGSLQHHGSNALAIAQHFGDMDLTVVPDSGDSVFFTIRPFLVRYPSALTPWLALVAMAGFAGAMWVRRPESTVRGTVRSLGAAALAGLSGALVGTVVWMLVTALHSTPGIVEVYLYAAVLLAVAILVARWVEDHVGGDSAVARRNGRIGLWMVLTLVTALAAPGFSYLFVWPSLAVVAGLLWRPVHRWWAHLRFFGIAACTLLLLTPAIDYLFLFAHPRPGNPDSELMPAVVVPLMLGLLVVALLANRWQQPDSAEST